ncbi:MAG TPA: hypothetical protein VGP41_08010 [Candidatus Lustribacter sp.]|jgi:hypothetical protein|nr:hypothetical protein [Candidatus Lustribacter sp.]
MRYVLPGQVFYTQESRKQRERKYRDWDGWLDLVAEYRKEAMRDKEPLHLNRPEPFNYQH